MGGGLIEHVRAHFTDRRGFGEHSAPQLEEAEASKRAWFAYWDEDSSGALDRGELVRALVKTFMLGKGVQQIRNMTETLTTLWALFDDDGSGTIEIDEFLRPNTGLADTVLAQMRAEAR